MVSSYDVINLSVKVFSFSYRCIFIWCKAFDCLTKLRITESCSLRSRFRRAADDYTDEEVEEFSEVLYTMQPDEVAGWNRSLILRGINLPNQIKDEVISFLS